MRKTLVPVILFVLLLPLQTFAQTVPSEGLAAEQQGNWERAIDVYKEAIREEPDRADLWVRISDIQARRGNPQKATEALEEAVKISPDDPELFSRLSQAYSVANQPERALKAVERALELDPDNIAYLDARAQLANWAGKSDLAAESYEKILHLSPGDDAALLGFARSSAWSGRLDKSACAYRRYLQRNPDAAEVYIEYAQVESWRGNYSAALDILEQYREKFGESKKYAQEKGKILAWANRPTKALTILSPVLQEEPDNYELNYARTIALFHDNRPLEAIDSLEKTTALQPDSEETEDLRRFILTPFRSNIEFSTRFYTDSDDLDRFTNSLVGTYWLSPLTSLEGGVSSTYLHAKQGSGLEEVDGGKSNWHTGGWIGGFRRLNPDVSVDGYAGAADADGNSHFIYGLGLDYKPLDNFSMRLERKYGYYVVSPRTIDLGIRQGANRASLVWEPNLLYTVVAETGFNTYSDDNEQWEAALAPRRAVLRREKFNLDIGVRGNWYGFKDQLDNGYYDPDFYQSYGVTGFGYIKLSDNDGISIVLDAGVLKDDEMDNFHFGWGGTVEGTFGLYRNVMLRLGASATDNSRQQGGAFRAYAVYAILTVRF